MAGRRRAARRVQPLQPGLGGAPRRRAARRAVLAEWWRRLVGRIIDVIVRRDHAGLASRSARHVGDVGLLAETLRAAETGASPPDQTAFAADFVGVVPITLIGMRCRSSTRRSSCHPGRHPREDDRRHRRAPGRRTRASSGVVDALKRQVITVAHLLLSLVPLCRCSHSGVSLLDPAWLLWDAKRQALHDKVADTVVVLRHPRPDRGRSRRAGLSGRAAPSRRTRPGRGRCRRARARSRAG